MSDSVFEALRPFLNAILIGLGGILIALIVSWVVSHLLARPMGSVWSRFIGSFLALAIGIWTVKVILDTTGAAGLLVVVVTAITGAFAIGSERIAGDLLAGVSLFVGRTYSAGDYVVIAGREGRVANVSLFLTTLETVNGDEIYIRNAEATNGTIINYSAHPGHLISVKVPLPVNQDLNKAVEAIQKAVTGFAPELSTKALSQPAVVVQTADEGYFIIEVRAYMTDRLDAGPEMTRLFLLAVNAIKEAGLSLDANA
ncbi:MAG: mechanosensitive ion channel family protein [Anaerolineae bacterium]|nr:mechanosensitive ion channel family protein [Anaerolineae bacterium]MBL8106002.1 mechanosensitive ion channel family protein [Anaerolineales bacterium]MCC7189097.1 mechanosensitive ion channel family protein [Anaerolineales bacterium]